MAEKLTKLCVLKKFLDAYGFAVEKHGHTAKRGLKGKKHCVWNLVVKKDKSLSSSREEKEEEEDRRSSKVFGFYGIENAARAKGLYFVSTVYSNSSKSSILDDLMHDVQWLAIEPYGSRSLAARELAKARFANPLHGCKSLEEACIKLDLMSLSSGCKTTQKDEKDNGQ